MLIHLFRNQPKGSAITGRLVINGRWFCNTMERVGYQIPALCYHVAVTQSPRFKRLLPIVQNVPQRTGIRFHRGAKPEHSTGCILVVADNINDNINNFRANQLPGAARVVSDNQNTTSGVFGFSAAMEADACAAFCRRILDGLCPIGRFAIGYR